MTESSHDQETERDRTERDRSSAGPALDPWVRHILRCPVGRHRLAEVTGPDGSPALQCVEDCDGPGRRRRYPVVDGIPVLLADDAEVVSG